MQKIPLRKGYSYRGADMGRPSFLTLDCNEAVRFQMEHLSLNNGGYDRGGAYWGFHPEGWKLYFALSVEDHPLRSYVGEEEMDRVETTTWAPDRAAAKANIRQLLPNAKFLR